MNEYLAASTFFTNEHIFGILIALISVSTSAVALVRGIRQDKRSKSAENLDEIFDASTKIVRNYTEDNESLRRRITDLEADMATMKQNMQHQIDELVTERNDLSHKLLRAQREAVNLRRQLEGA